MIPVIAFAFASWKPQTMISDDCSHAATATIRNTSSPGQFEDVLGQAGGSAGPGA